MWSIFDFQSNFRQKKNIIYLFVYVKYEPHNTKNIPNFTSIDKHSAMHSEEIKTQVQSSLHNSHTDMKI